MKKSKSTKKTKCAKARHLIRKENNSAKCASPYLERNNSAKGASPYLEKFAPARIADLKNLKIENHSLHTQNNKSHVCDFRPHSLQDAVRLESH